MRILCLLPDSLGDFILTTPSLQSLHRNFPEHEIIWALRETLLEASTLISLDAKRVPLRRWKPIQTPDLTVCFPPSTQAYLGAFRFGGTKRIGYVHEQMWIPRIISRLCLTDRWICPSQSPLHEVEAYGRILSLISVKFNPTFPQLSIPSQNLSEALKKVGARRDRNIVSLHLGSRWDKNPLPILESIVKKLHGSLIISLFSHQEELRAREMLKDSSDSTLAPGPGSLSRVLAYLKLSHLFIGVDGGLVHLAAALGIPTIVFYPPNHFEFQTAKWHPWNVSYKSLPLSNKGYAQLPDVVEFLLRQRKESRAPSRKDN